MKSSRAPLANGFLTGKYPPPAETAAAEQHAGGGRLAAAAGYPDQRTHTDRDWTVLAAVRNAATTLGCSPAQIALAWTLHQPAVATTLIGATSTEQLHADLDAAALTMTGSLRADSGYRPGGPTGQDRCGPGGLVKRATHCGAGVEEGNR
jgi:aryl-alcohol dehydrogenase-like predicted oxidoreductase